MKIAGIEMDATAVLLALHGTIEGVASLVNIVAPMAPWDTIQPPVVNSFVWSGVFSGAVLALATLLGPRPVPSASLLTLATMHLGAMVMCIPGGPGGYMPPTGACAYLARPPTSRLTSHVSIPR